MFPFSISRICKNYLFLILAGVNTIAEWYGSLKQRKGKDYIVFDKIDINATVKTGHINLENLFENNAALTEAANQAFNDNMDLLKEELYPMFNEVISTILKAFYNRVHDLFPVDDLFPRD